MSDQSIGDWYAAKDREAREIAEEIDLMKRFQRRLNPKDTVHQTALAKTIKVAELYLERARYVGD